nr:unnamed protein product [Digitaria exilis]
MTTDDIIGELKLFYFAGMETTAVLLKWTMVVLSMHPEWQERAREEVLRVFGKNQPDYECINQLKTTELGGVKYPPGVVFSFPIVCIHHNPEVWGEDVDEFRPERFCQRVSPRHPGTRLHSFHSAGGHGYVWVRTLLYWRPR